jgi:diguanylate cyclase (GGDEF)-like protein
MVGRLGGDEFAVMVEGAAGDVKKRIQDVKKHMNGDYSLATQKGKAKVPITAAIGLAAWKPGTSVQQVLNAADQAMYEDKKRMSQALSPAKP